MKYLYVAIGGMLGCTLRYAFSLIPFHMYFPLDTLIVNSIGSFLLGYITFNPKIANELRLCLGVGALGSFTTFSTFSNESLQLLLNAKYLLCFTNITLTISIGLLFAYFGMKTAKGAN